MSVPDLSVGCRFADYFSICGLDFDSGLEPDRLCGDNLHVSPLDRAYKGKILAHYPDNIQSNPFDEHAVCMLCLPAGLQFRTQKHSLDPKFHSFVVTRENASRYYGFSLIFYEEVRNRNICSAMHTLQAMYITELSSGQTPPGHRKGTGKESSRSLPRSFKLTPHSGAALTYYDIAKDKLYVAKSIALICQYPYVRVAQLFLENLFRSLPRQPGPGLSPESYVYNLLYEVPVPLSGQALRLYVPPSEPHLDPIPVVIRMPNPPEELPLLDYPLRVMFQTLGVECVVQLFTCVLLEHQVLLRSSDYNKLMLVAECAVSLLLPFSWAHVYVPILPAPLYHFLDAPVPFVMGLHAESSAAGMGQHGPRNVALGSEAALCLVDIDKPDIQLPEELPIFPHRTPFVEELNHVLDKHQIQRPETEPTKLGVPLNGTSYKSMNDSMSSSCTLPSGGLRRKHSFHDVLEWEESRPLNASPPASPTRRAPLRMDALQRIVDIVKRTGVNIDDVDAETVMPTVKKKILNDEEQYNEDIRFNVAIRETFLNRFVHMFLMYENFVIMPDQDRDSWLTARESMVNFDKASFLSDQPQRHRPFLSRFLETQMFATLIDNKIMANWGEYDANLQVFEHRIKAVRTNSLKRIKNAKWQVKDCPPELLLGDISRKLSTDVTPAAIAQNNRTFVEKLLKECKSKTKRMLVEKMGTEESDLGLGSEVSITGVEESTMIASLCDLLERLWSHGLQHKMGKSALWMHLTNYQELEQCSNSTKPIDPNYLTPDLSSVGAEVEAQQSTSSGSRSRDSSRGGSRDSSRDRLSNSGTLERKSSQPPNPMRPLPESLTFDMRNVQAMTDIKTEIGYARAWVRLSLEKKLLSKHLRELLADTTLLRSQYKRTAFLRCEEEREQFLYHLLTLNAVDYHCFTNTYPTTKLPYRVLIVPSRKASQTTANCWISISGTNRESTPKIPIPRNTNEFVFHHKNLGILSTLRIGHDNSGLSPRWLLDQVFVRNEVTGHTYTFPCNRWLGTGVDDGSTERLLLAARVRGSRARTPHPPPAPASHPATPTTHLSTATIQHMIGDCVNAIVKWHYQSKREKDANSLSVLLCGENGLVKCLEQAFLCGFKSARLFGKNLFIWDYFARVKDEFKMSLCDEQSSQSNKSCGVAYNCRQDQEHRSIWRCYCHLMDEINTVGRTLGKDGKFQLFICLSLREHWLHRMLVPMSMTRVTTEMYEEQSFLRKRGLLTFLRQILEPLDEFDIVLENSLTQGI
ncbi:DENN domain-containing protein 5B isoform X4 [Ostrinia furnacalis]|uniref:DENN domain-containing protein 5B isoform X3 n=1 Tax=Ostrinia furnacalis TaxID=93504 RepID=UPI00103DDC5C|nr:DENN domain-containing protein 5B isoform X3 [Ostrinia furnacalis]XP_028177391.1 DENN domain-containing protein 5B isoform X4 [Ostrinia furnacalis]